MTLLIATAIIPVTGTIENWRIENINKESKPLFQPPEQWNETFGGTSDDIGYSVQQTADGGYIVTGFQLSGSINTDVYLIKTDSSGGKNWEKTFGGTLPDEGWSVCQIIGGGYIITGKTSSYGAGGSDVWLIKTDGDGNQQWSKTFGGTSDDWGRSVVEISDGYVIAGSTSSYGAGGSDVWLIKTDGDGNQQWSKTFGGTSDDWGWSVQEISGGFIIVGTTYSYGAGGSDVWLIKTDSNGNKLWDKTFGGVADDRGWSVQEVSSGYIIAGLTSSYGSGNYDCWLIKTDSNGNEQWSEAYGGIDNDIGYSMQQTSDGGYVIAGGTASYGAGGSDVWLIKIASGVNNPPNTPINPNPVNHAIDIDVDADLSWTGGDPDPGDTVTYDIYLGTSSSPPKIVTGQSGTTFDPGTMGASTKYYWQIVAWDNHGASTSGPVWDFTTSALPNSPPNTPSNPNPTNHATGVDVNADLGWTCSDPDVGDTLIYDVYFGTTSTPPNVATGQSSTTYDPGTITAGTKYYWQIVAWDNHGASTSGPVWDFTTAGGVNSPPNKPQTPSGKINGKAGNSYPYTTSADDPNSDKVKYGWDKNGDGAVDQWDDNGGSYYSSGATITTYLSWSSQGTYTLKVLAEDTQGAQSVWSDPLSISMPKTRQHINTPFLNFLENHPHLFPLLRQIMGL